MAQVVMVKTQDGRPYLLAVARETPVVQPLKLVMARLLTHQTVLVELSGLLLVEI